MCPAHAAAFFYKMPQMSVIQLIPAHTAALSGAAIRASCLIVFTIESKNIHARGSHLEFEVVFPNPQVNKRVRQIACCCLPLIVFVAMGSMFYFVYSNAAIKGGICV